MGGVFLQAVFDESELLVLLRDFHTLTGLRAVVFDASGVDILSYPNDLPAFCQLIRSTPNGQNNCQRCDQNACQAAQSASGTLIYTCHAGLLEMITPIEVEGVVIGYLLLAHIAKEDTWQQVQTCCASYQIESEALKHAYHALPHTTQQMLSASADLLALAAKALYHERIARLAPDNHRIKLTRFLSEHLSEDLSCERLCRVLSLSRSALYHLSYELYGCGVSEQISRMRMQQAQKLLCDTELSIPEICREIGFRDVNYFYRVFRRQTGRTPKEFRRQFMHHDSAAN